MYRKKLIKPVHPGVILLEEFLEPMGISQYRLAKDISVPARRINEVIKGKRAITVDTALRLALFFDMSSSFWLGLQKDYELDVAKIELQQKIKKEVHPWHGRLAVAWKH
ncbi:MAG: HigA family addiction module antidote protein [Proteobacteria bacterium]|nr:HigA family addiction module antidote protein [Pseudomonadota bacterium]